jgi:hypothetical protein
LKYFCFYTNFIIFLPLGRLRPGWEDNIKIDLRQVKWWNMNWISLAVYKDRWMTLVNAVMKIWVP